MSTASADEHSPPVLSADLNADVAEGYGRWSFGTDEDLLGLITSANVACGFHAGDPTVIRSAVQLAADRRVRIGAHIGYPDLLGFGRRHLAMSEQEVVDSCVYQLAALTGIARSAGTTVSYVKPHGALYNEATTDEALAAAVVRGVGEVDGDLAVMGMPGSALLRAAARAGHPTIREAFADRAYNPDGTLVARHVPGSLLNDPADVAARALRMVTEREVEAIDGTVVEVQPDRLCVHGDSPGAAAMAAAVRRTLEAAGVLVHAARASDSW
jgi:UPF0271 protein